MIEILNKIRGYRNMIGETQDDFAKMLGISRQAYIRKEDGRSKFKDGEKKIIRDHFRKQGIKTSIDDLFF